MIRRLQLLRNVGTFDSVAAGAAIDLAPLTLIYAENGRGKSTLAAILRSLATGDAVPITERRRLAAAYPPHVVLDCDGGPPAAMFQNNAWTRTVPNMAVFDEVFIDRSVYSGLVVAAEHRQNLHELILGAQAVDLSREQEEAIKRIESHNTELRVRAAAIPAEARGPWTVEEFCVLPARADIDDAIQAAERALDAARQQDPIRQAQAFDRLWLPELDVAAVAQVLTEDLPALNASAAGRIQAHIATLGPGGERWIDDGMRRIPPGAGPAGALCPFCAQSLAGSAVIQHYQAYFSAGYTALKERVTARLAAIERNHGGESQAAFERAVRVASERAQFWSRFCDVPTVSVDTAAIVRDWVAARDAVAQVVLAKQAAPLEQMALPPATSAAVAAYEAHRRTIADLDEALNRTNGRIAVVKEQAATASAEAIAGDLARLRAVKARHTPDVVARCEDYMAELVAKAKAEEQRDQARAALERYRRPSFLGTRRP